MSVSLIGIKSVTYAVVILLFILICVVDKRVLQLSMLRYNAHRFDVNVSDSLDSDTIDAEPLVIADHSQVTTAQHIVLLADRTATQYDRLLA